jgi:UDP-glucose 4-epimerase
MSLLITGGSGFIGSHICIELLNAGHKLMVLDNLSNSSVEALKRVCEITKKKLSYFPEIDGDLIFSETSITDQKALKEIFKSIKIETVIHCAGLKSVSESLEDPLRYYDNNVSGSIALFKEMIEAGVYKIIFSSSATVYGEPKEIPINEECLTGNCPNPYGKTKYFIEEILEDLNNSGRLKVCILRYFNPVGAHSSGLIGEDPIGIPNNIMPIIGKIALGRQDKLSIYGKDWPTTDGTAIRDYIHVVDLAKGHLAALTYFKIKDPEFNVFNLGTGKGTSVLELVKTFEETNKVDIPFHFSERRQGDVAESYTSIFRAKEILKWEAKKNLELICKDAWQWLKNNPNGYK